MYPKTIESTAWNLEAEHDPCGVYKPTFGLICTEEVALSTLGSQNLRLTKLPKSVILFLKSPLTFILALLSSSAVMVLPQPATSELEAGCACSRLALQRKRGVRRERCVIQDFTSKSRPYADSPCPVYATVCEEYR